MTHAEAEVLAQAFSRDGASAVVSSMVGDRAVTEDEAQKQVGSVMQSLEKMADHCADAACSLMLSLWPIASELMMHDVCDRIDLWIDHNRSAAVASQLRRLISSHADSGLKRHFEGLLVHIEQKA
jgi:hypothetical protein